MNTRLGLVLGLLWLAGGALAQSPDPSTRITVSPATKDGRPPQEFDSTIITSDEDTARGGAKLAMGVFINMSFQLNGTIHVSLTQPVNGDTKEYVHRKRFRDLPAGYYSDYYDASDSNPLANFRDPTLYAVAFAG